MLILLWLLCGLGVYVPCRHALLMTMSVTLACQCEFAGINTTCRHAGNMSPTFPTKKLAQTYKYFEIADGKEERQAEFFSHHAQSLHIGVPKIKCHDKILAILGLSKNPGTFIYLGPWKWVKKFENWPICPNSSSFYSFSGPNSVPLGLVHLEGTP